MQLRTITEKLEKYITDNSKLDQQRPYIGMSSIADCNRKIVLAYYNGITIDKKAHLNSYRGYSMERIAKEILTGAGIMKPGSERELYAVYNELLRGHTDGEAVTGELIEIKSKSKEKFDAILASGKLSYRDFCQVQTYMHFGGYNSAIVFILCPETFDTHTMRIYKHPATIATLVQKADVILHHIDNKTVPLCTCRKCNAQNPKI